MSRCPALLIAAPASGQGKTTITAALARWHTQQGRRVRVFKCGPDYLDPYWHALASGAPVHNLDGWMVGMDAVRARLADAAQEADLILIEGVMGLFDGRPTAADLAQQLGIPVLLVVDAAAMAGSFGALVLGMQLYQPGVPFAGVLANRVGSAMHAQMLQSSLRDTALWQGAVQRLVDGKDGHLLPERHLGLIAAHELPDAMERLDRAAEAIGSTPLCQQPWADWQRWAVDFPSMPAAPSMPPLLQGKTIAIARDAAFSFIYPANLDCLRSMGAQLAFFSPLAGERLPVCDALWLPGGYPELHAAKLAANTALARDLHAHVEAGKAIWAECGGMMALSQSITDAEGVQHPMWAVLPGHARMQTRLGGLGMQQCVLQGGVLRGHTFHYSRFESEAPQAARTSRADQPVSAQSGEAIYAWRSVHASYFHAWFASHPAGIAALLGAVAVQWEGGAYA
ncbi:MAG: cobyrinate a,c-diamide synthase [Comamonas sp.]|nr:cobyrinate a,c-diamide synthase [Comamonas sp.]